MTAELYKRYRPKNLEDVVGQPKAVQVLTKMANANKIPHTIMFTGPSGCGKTSLARILRNVLKCGKSDYNEINCGMTEKPIDMIREIQRRMGAAPIGGSSRMWVLDETQSLSRAGFAQQALLKILEDTPSHVYFILCTTDPNKVIKTIRTRCTVIDVKSLTPKYMMDLLSSVSKKEKFNLSEELAEKIIEVSGGSAREALVHLDSVMRIEDDEDRIETIQSSEAQSKGIDLARLLLKARPGDWGEVGKMLKNIDEDPETIRYIVMGYGAAILMNGGGKIAPRAAEMIAYFSDHFYDSKKPGLVLACYGLVHGK